jgi:5-methyltetrahydrofolate corrinoid/iron sulfur protein methyltransferase
MVMLERNGLYSAIADVLDQELIDLNRGSLDDIRVLIHRVMDGELVDADALPESEKNYVKTARVLMGDALYSHAWLES